MDADDRQLAARLLVAVLMIAAVMLLAGLVFGTAVRLFLWAAWG